MSPTDLAKNNSESGHQKALLSWAGMAMNYGFIVANNDSAYTKEGLEALRSKYGSATKVPCLKWLHSNGNGGKRDAVTAARMKAEGAKKGIPDLFLPFPVGEWHGLYIELKRTGKHAVSPEQLEFMSYAIACGYEYQMAEGWRIAADKIKRYVTYKNTG